MDKIERSGTIGMDTIITPEENAEDSSDDELPKRQYNVVSSSDEEVPPFNPAAMVVPPPGDAPIETDSDGNYQVKGELEDNLVLEPQYQYLDQPIPPAEQSAPARDNDDAAPGLPGLDTVPSPTCSTTNQGGPPSTDKKPAAISRRSGRATTPPPPAAAEQDTPDQPTNKSVIVPIRVNPWKVSSIRNLQWFYCVLFACWAHTARGNILVVGSLNADTFLPVSRLPVEGENIMLTPGKQPVVDIPGGKGCTQAVAAAKLCRGRDLPADSRSVFFVGQFGNDAAAKMLRTTLEKEGVQIPSICVNHHKDLPSGRGYVFLTESGSVAAVVSGGSNSYGWRNWDPSEDDANKTSTKEIDNLLEGIQCVMLQREIPEFVNLLIATQARKRGIVVLQDIGGEERGMTCEMMEACDYLIPNESELIRLCQCFEPNDSRIKGQDESKLSGDIIVGLAKTLQQYGARNVLVTQGSRGSTLVTESGEVLHQPAFPLEQSEIVDETGAGDCYRAAFATALLEGHPLPRCLEFASAAGCCSVQVQGAVPSAPSREKVEDWYHRIRSTDSVLNIPRGDGQGQGISEDNAIPSIVDGLRTAPSLSPSESLRGGNTEFPFLIGSRLNSMKDRPELWTEEPLKTPRDFVKRQAKINGLSCVDFNYPQHFGEGVWANIEDVRKTLEDAGLVAGAVCLRYPSKFARGAMNHPDASLRRAAIDMTKEAAQVAMDLGCDEVVVWSAFDGYDYPFQVDYDKCWLQLVEAFQECCDAYPNIKFSLEYKPTDENTRFFTVPSTGAALLIVEEIDRPNMGLTLDVGHMLMSGENPAQSIAMVGRKKKLFGIQLNDGYTRLAAEDGMMFGSIHPSMALEIMHQLRKTNFAGHLYFDTFPQRSDPVKEAEYNIKRVKEFWYAAEALEETELKQATDEHDAIKALEIVNKALRSL